MNMLTHEFSLSDIESQSAKNPMAIAVCHDGQTFSYRDLEVSANRLANYLKHFRVAQGDIVVLYMRRSFDLIVAMLAVWKIGATYVSLDFETPSERVISIINQSKPKCIITEPALLNDLPQEFPLLTCQDPELLDFDHYYESQTEKSGKNAAYLIYTSGSTGQPKGVLVTHDNLSNYIFWFNKHFNITNQDVFSFNTSPAFDFAVTCLHAPLVAGGQILITSEADVLDIETYINQLVKHRVTFAKWTPSYFKILVNYVEKYKPDLSHLRYLMIAGEELLVKYVERWFEIYPSHNIINEYGPTETTVGITTQLITKSNLNKQLKTVPIGQPVRNSNLYIVDSHGNLLPQGEVGELWIGGASVALGYYKSSELTQRSFIKNPFSEKNEMLYKTGDLVKQLPDKSYLYIGRIDNQVKINGYRVEINEVEHYLLQHPEIDQACIVVREDEGNNRYLEAYIVLKSQDHSFNVSELRKNISQCLPQFMIPQYYHIIDHIPLTANCKIDHRALIAEARHLEARQSVE